MVGLGLLAKRAFPPQGALQNRVQPLLYLREVKVAPQ